MLMLNIGLDSLHAGLACEESYEHLRADVQYEEGPLWQHILSHFMASLMTNKGFYPLYCAWKESRPELQGIKILDAHADWRRGEWRFSADKPADTPVQEWVRTWDGKAALLILHCCNPRNRGTVSTKHSLVIHYRSSTSVRNMLSRRTKARIFVPGFGYCDAGSQRLTEVTTAIESGQRPLPSHLKLFAEA